MDEGKCYRCRGKAVIDIQYGEGSLCRDCFIRLFEKRVKRTVRKNRLLAGDDRILVGLSGGKDSMTALKILNEIVGRNPNTEIAALTVDEGISEVSGERIGCAKKLCGELGIEHRIIKFRDFYGFELDAFLENDSLESNPCTYCGVLRRRLINTKARQWGFTKVVTGHNLDDEVQAALMNFVRGEVERIARLGGRVGVMSIEGFVPRIKPLRDCLEDEVKLYSELMGFEVASTECPYSRAAFRKSMAGVIDGLEVRHPGSKYQMLRSVDKLVEYMRDAVPKEGVTPCVSCGEPSSGDKCKVCLILES